MLYRDSVSNLTSLHLVVAQTNYKKNKQTIKKINPDVTRVIINYLYFIYCLLTPKWLNLLVTMKFDL